MKTRRRMVLLALLGALALPLPAGAQQAGAGDDLAAVPRIEVSELKKLLAGGGVLIVDVRDATAYGTGHIPGAISVPLEEVQARAAALKGEKRPIVTYCA